MSSPHDTNPGMTPSSSLDAFNAVGVAQYSKQQQLADATQRKRDALSRITQSQEFRDSWKGELSSLFTDSDYVRSFVGGAVRGTGSIVDAAAGFTGSNTIEGAGDWFQEGADAIDQSRLGSTQDNVRTATPTGDLFDPSSWDFGDGNADGLLNLLAGVTGQLAPQVAGGLAAQSLKKGAAIAAGLGGAQAAGGAMRDQWDFVDSLSHEELLTESGLYADLVTTGTPPEEAREMVRERAALAAGIPAGVIGAAGGAATQYILRGLPGKLSSNILVSGAEEGVQEVAEGVAARVSANAAIDGDRDITADTLTDFVLGAGAGAGVSATVKGAQALGKKAEDTKKAAGAFSIKDVDIETAADPESTEYDPAKAAPAIHDKVKSGELAPEDANEKLEVMEKDLTESLDAQKALYERTDPENLDLVEQGIAKEEQALAVEPDATKQAQIETAKELLAQYRDVDRKALKEGMNLTGERYEAVRQIKASLSEADADVAPEVEEVNNTGTEDNVIVRAMNNPDSFSAAELQALVADTSNGLTDTQRTFLRAMSKSKVRSESVDAVNADIIAGGNEGYRSLPEYRQEMAKAVQQGNQKNVNALVKDLRNFNASHTGKAKAAAKANAAAERIQQPVHILRDADNNTWQVSRAPMSVEAVRENGGLTFQPNGSGTRIAEAIGYEAELINETLEEVTAMARLKADDLVAVSPEPSQQPEVASSPASTEISEEPANAESNSTPESEQKPEPAVSAEPAKAEPDPDAEAITDPVEVVNTKTEEDPAKVEPGALPGMAKGTELVSPDGTYQSADLLRSFFIQRESGRPLVAVRDLLSVTETNGTDLLGDYFDGDMSDAQVNALRAVLATARTWGNTLDELWKPNSKATEYRYQNVMTFLEEDGRLPENVKTAIAVAAYDWLAANIRNLSFNTDDEIKAILGKDSSARLTPAEAKELRWAGKRQAFVTSDLGKSAVQALGLRATDKAPKNLQSDLEQAMGTYALAMLVDGGILARNMVSGAVFDADKGNERHAFVVASNWKSPMPEELSVFPETLKGTQSILPQLFGTTRNTRAPLLTPEEHTQRKIKNSDTVVPARHNEIRTVEQSRAWKVRTDSTAGLFLGMSEDTQLLLSGFRPVTEGMHVNTQERVNAKNEGYRRELENFKTFIADHENELGELKFYLPSTIWKVQRTGIASDQVNPQSSKIHRHLVSMEEWQSTVSTDPNSDSYKQFMLAVAVGLDIPVDKMTHASALADVENAVKAPEYQAAVDALAWGLSGNALSEDMEAAVVAAVQKADGNLHSYDALVGLAQLKVANDRQEDSFTTDMMFEVDGVTNGPMLTHLFLGAAESPEALTEFVERGGFFNANAAYTSFGDFKEKAGNNDLYETLAARLYGRVMQDAANHTPAVNAVQTLIGDIYDSASGKATSRGRKLVKTPTTALAFGSAISNTINDMGGELLESFENQLEKLYEKGANQDQVDVLIGHFNDVVGGYSTNTDLQIPVGTPLSSLLKMEWTAAQEEAFIGGFVAAYGGYIKEAVNDVFSVFVNNRQTMNMAAGVSFSLYYAAYTNLRKAYVNELMELGDVPRRTTKKGKVQIADLTSEQEQAFVERLRDAYPAVHTYFSSLEDNLNAGLAMYKSKRTLTKDDTYRQNVNLARALKGKGPNGVKSIESRGLLTSLAEPGVATLIMQIHSSDSAISSLALEQSPVLNVHDAHGAGLSNVANAANNLNKATFDVLLNYSVPLEASNALDRTIAGVHELMVENPGLRHSAELQEAIEQVYTAAARALPEGVADSVLVRNDPATTLKNISDYVAGNARHMEMVKLLAMGNIEQVNQYSYEGGAYTLTADDKNAVTERVDALRNDSRKAPDTELFTVPRLNQGTDFVALLTQVPGDRVLEAARDMRRESKSKALGLFLRSLVSTGDVASALANSNPDLAKSLYNRIKDVPVLKVERDLTDREQVTALVSAMVGKFPLWETQLSALSDALGDRRLSLGEALDKSLLNDTDGGRAAEKEALNAFLRRAGKVLNVSPWGPIGPAVKASNPNLVNYLAGGPERSAQDVLRFVRNDLRKNHAGRPMARYYDRLAQMIGKRIGDVPVHYITPTSGKLGGSYAGKGTASAFSVTGKNPYIGIKSTDFTYSNVTTETVLHEMLHAVLVPMVNADTSDPGKRVPGMKHIRELQGLLDAVKTYVSQDEQLLKQFAPALENMDEFISWGMTNKAFQERVLKRVEYTPRGTRTLTDAFKAFINGLIGLLYGRATEADANGLAVLVSEVSQMLAVAETDMQASTERAIVRNMDTAGSNEAMTAVQVFDGLQGNNSPRVRGLLREVVAKVYGANGALQVEGENQAAYNPTDMYMRYLASGKLPYTSALRGMDLRLSQQESYVAEQIEMTIRTGLDVSSASYRALAKLYREARNTVTPEVFLNSGTWTQATATEKVQAQAVYDSLFNLTSANGRQDYLSRFAALALTYEPLFTALDRNVEVAPVTERSLIARLERWFEQLLDFLTGKLTHTNPGDRLHKQLTDLIGNMAQQKAEREMQLEKRRSDDSGRVMETINRFTKATRTKLGKLPDLPVFDDKGPLVGLAREATKLVVNDRLEQLEKQGQEFRNRMIRGRQGVIASMATEIKGETADTRDVHNLARAVENSERLSKQFSEGVKNVLKDSFEDGGQYLEAADRDAITSVMLETDMSVLLKPYEQSEIASLLGDRKTLTGEIARLERRVAPALGRYQHYILRGATDLGYKMATGINRDPNLALNVDVLLSMAGTPMEGKIGEAARTEVREDLDVLITLRALLYTNEGKKARVKRIMERETPRGDYSGTLTVLRQHRKMKGDALKELFHNNPMLVRKGYIREVFNQTKDITTADARKGAELEALGYVKGHKLRKDPHDPKASDEHVYVADGFGLRRRETGIVTLTSKRSRGTQVGAGLDRVTGAQVTAQMQQARRNDIMQRMRPQPGYNPEAIQEAFAVPNRNEQGTVVSYRYEMTTATKDSLMERDNDFLSVMGGMAANAMNKVKSEEQNKEAAELLYSIYNKEFADKPHNFVRFSEDSNDPEIAEAARLLPTAMRKNLKQLWGNQDVYVPIELYDLFFAYRRKSISALFDKKPEDRNKVETIIATVLETVLGKKAALRLQQAEDFWMEAVKLLKDIVVIRNLFTLVGNVISNVSVLAMSGVPLSDMVKNHRVGMQGLFTYQRDSARVTELKTMRDAGIPYAGNIEHEIATLEDALARNPVKELADAGMLHTIVEDLDADDNSKFASGNKMVRWVQEKVESLPEPLLEVGKQVTVSPGTPIYSLLYKGTHMSDFVARYVMYQNLINRKNNPLSKADAIAEIDKTFIRYGTPTHSKIDWANRMGFALFTKYYLRIQAVLMRLYKDQPIRSLLVSLLGNFIDVNTVSDSVFYERFGNILSGGAVELPSAFDEIITMNLVKDIFF